MIEIAVCQLEQAAFLRSLVPPVVVSPLACLVKTEMIADHFGLRLEPLMLPLERFLLLEMTEIAAYQEEWLGPQQLLVSSAVGFVLLERLMRTGPAACPLLLKKYRELALFLVKGRLELHILELGGRKQPIS